MCSSDLLGFDVPDGDPRPTGQQVGVLVHRHQHAKPDLAFKLGPRLKDGEDDRREQNAQGGTKYQRLSEWKIDAHYDCMPLTGRIS